MAMTNVPVKLRNLQSANNPRGQEDTLVIEHHGHHLKLRHDNQLEISKGGGPMLLKVEVHKAGASHVILWFPDSPPVFQGPREFTIPVFQTGPKLWEGEILLNVNASHPGGVVPYAIFCDMNGGQEGTENPDFDQKGRQMVDGQHSHPDCNVGP
jgi:hypothetical protein